MNRTKYFMMIAAAALSGLSVALGSADGAYLIAGLALVVLGADWLVEGAASLAHRLGVSSFIVGLTVVAFGTSAPELAASIRAALSGESDLAIGNVVGSNIANVCLILGLTAVVRPVPCKAKVVRTDVPIMIAVTILGMVFLWTDRTIVRWEGVVLVLGLFAYTFGIMLVGRGEKKALAAELEQKLGEFIGTSIDEAPNWRRHIISAVAGIAALAIGSWLLVDGATGVALSLGVSESVVGLSMVAFGTSVPELVTSLAAAIKREADIAVGNILGSNCFNILSVLGISSLVAPLVAAPAVLDRDMWVMLMVAAACLPVFGTMGRITRWEGGTLLAIYVLYLVILFI
ncbi:MAG: calcium/sodium antiporter [Phycisphaerales bacterium JB037]